MKKQILIYLCAYIFLFLAYALLVYFLSNNLTNAGQFGDMFGALNAFFTGLAFLSVILLTQYNLHNEKNEKKEKQKTILKITIDELNYNKIRLEEIRNILIEKSGVPSFTLQVSNLSFLKNQLMHVLSNAEIIRSLSNCEFELSHINDRLKMLNENLLSTDPVVQFGQDLNIDNTILTVTNVIDIFVNATTSVSTELGKLK